MPAERGKDAADRFAAAVDEGRSPRSAGSDADLARELEIVAQLRSREGTYASHAEAMAMLRSGAQAYSPRQDEKARAKARLMALLAEQHVPRAAGSDAAVVAFPPVTAADHTAPIPVVAGDAEPSEAAPDTTVHTDGSAPVRRDDDTPADDDAPLAPVTPLAGRTSRRAGRHSLAGGRLGRVERRRAVRSDDPGHGLVRRAGVVGSAALFVLIAFGGTGVFVSRDALPGQTLYPLKRAAEAASLAMTFDDEARAQRNLELAAIRLSEIEQLIALRGGSGVDPQLVAAAMSEFDDATSEGSRALLSRQGANLNGETLQAWAAKQSARLSALRPALPVPAVPAADASIALLDKLLGRSPDATNPALGEGGSTPDTVTTSGPAQQNRSGQAGTASQPDSIASPDQDGIPGLKPENGPLGTQPEQPATQTPSTSNDSDSPQLPLPLPGAPVTLPPLLPGMPPLTIG